MNKTIFKLNYKNSIIIVSIVGIIFSFLSNAFYINGVMEFILYTFRLLLFLGIYLVLYFIEKDNIEFKESLKRIVGYMGATTLINLSCGVFVGTHLLSGLFIAISGIACLWLILAFVMEVLQFYIKNKFITNFYLANKKIGLTFANPIIKLFNITNG